MTGKIKAISISEKKGRRKDNIDKAMLIAAFGIEGDAHGGKWHRQLSFLAEESIEFMRQKGLDVVAGNFAENITTENIDLTALAVGDHLTIGDTEMIISQLGKICHTRCAIYHQAGDCVMPREGIFAVVTKGGRITVGENIEKTDKRFTSAAVVVENSIDTATCEELAALTKSAYSPAFVRVDAITEKTGGSLPAILEDLTQTQKINDIVIFDPDGTLGLSIPAGANSSSRIHRIRSLSELTAVETAL